MAKSFDQNASSQSPFVSGNTPMLHDQMSVIEIRPLRSMDDVALSVGRWLAVGIGSFGTLTL